MEGDTSDDNASSSVHDPAMLHLFPGPIHRLVLRVAHGIRLRWWRLTGKVVRGCNVVAFNSSGQILLVRHSYHLAGVWMLPGGGLDKDESPLEGACRELAEEVGCTLASPRHVATMTLNWSRWTNIVELVCGEISDAPQPDGREIAAARFFDPVALPHPTSKAAQDMIARWLQDQNGSSV